MKGGKKNSGEETTSAPPSEGVAGDNGGGAVQVEQQQVLSEDAEKPKLAEGFYEIEAIRQKRVRKSKVQYLIKWKGWPETANTWEPVQNLMTCYDVIEAFEDSLRGGKQRSKRKHKQSHGATHSQTKIKEQPQPQQPSPAAATYDVPAVKVTIMEEPMPSSSPASLDAINHTDGGGSDLNDINVDEAPNGKGPKSDSSVKEINEKNELDLRLSELKGVIPTKETTVDRPSDGLSNGFSMANGTESLQFGRCTGAKRRKPASVRRFKQGTTSGVRSDTQDAVNATSGPLVTLMREDVHGQGSQGDAPGWQNKCENPKDADAITEIIKPMSYTASVSNDSQDVCVTFLVKRSDGKNVVVDNKFLKMNNPLLLINFYEQRLRYQPDRSMSEP